MHGLHYFVSQKTFQCLDSGFRQDMRYPVSNQICGIRPDIRFPAKYPVSGQISGIRPDIRYPARYPVLGQISGTRPDIRYPTRYPVFGIRPDIRYPARTPILPVFYVESTDQKTEHVGILLNSLKEK